MAKNPRIVAELGRPETPEETAERKARDSRLRRERQTLSNLIYALLASVAMVAVIVAIVPRSDTPIDRNIDAEAAAERADSTLGTRALVPNISETITSAEIRRSSDDVTSWFVGYVTAGEEYIGFSQAVDANEGWIAIQMAETRPDGSVDVDGLTWVVYDNRDSNADVGNAEYGMVTEVTDPNGVPMTLVLSGSASVEEFQLAAREVARALEDVN